MMLSHSLISLFSQNPHPFFSEPTRILVRTHTPIVRLDRSTRYRHRITREPFTLLLATAPWS